MGSFSDPFLGALRSPSARYGGAGLALNRPRRLPKINIDIEHGDFFGLLGPNGAGKTTTIGILTGLVNLTSGSVKVDGHDIIKEYKKTRSKIGLSPQEINLDVFFTIKEILTFQGGYYGLNLREAQKRAIFILMPTSRYCLWPIVKQRAGNHAVRYN